MAAKNKPGAPGVFDISKPGSGQLAASSTSRPVMITNRPVIKDPMVNDVAVPDPKPAPAKSEPTKKLVIQPLHEGIVPEDAPVVQTLQPVEDIKPAEKVIEDKPEAPDVIVEEPAEAHDPVLPAGVPSGKSDDKQLTPEQADAALKASQDHAAKLRKAIEDEQYFLPINSVEERRSRRIAIVGIVLILLLAAAWYDTALDAGLLTNMYNLPHTHFFTIK